MAIPGHILREALTMIGPILHADGLQAIVRSNNSLVDRMYDLTNVNRDIDPAWVAEMKKEIVASHERGIFMTVTVGLDLRDIRSIMEATQANPDAGGEELCPFRDGFRVRVYDGQHRLKALSELYREDPNKEYSFFVMVYIVESNEDEKTLLEKINRRREFTQKDRVVVDARKRFLDVWDEATTQDHQNRLCIRNIRSSKRIRSDEITEALSRMSPEMMRSKLYEIAESYHAEFLRECESNKFVKSVVHKVISDTKLYQLVCYYRGKDDSWLDQLALPKTL